jgi:hypothetical protein
MPVCIYGITKTIVRIQGKRKQPLSLFPVFWKRRLLRSMPFKEINYIACLPVHSFIY